MTSSVEEVPVVLTPGLPAEIRETHSGVVALVGNRAFKVKKPVDLGFLDFRTEAARRHACWRELELNRRLAPDVYLDVATVSGSDGQVDDHVIVMRRMPEALRLSTMIRRGADVEGNLRDLARLMATFHAGAERGPQIAAAGRPAALRHRWTDNLAETQKFLGTTLDPEMHRRITELALRYIDGRATLLEDRVARGMIVDGHGDLITEDIFCLPDHPRVLDCLEFDDQLRYVDVLDDIAFLTMDLEYLGRPDLARHFLDSYDGFSHTPSVTSLQHHYVAYRAFVRAKVACIRAAQGVPTAVAEADAHARLALAHLEAGEVTLTLVGGAPGTGKTTLATGLAELVGAVVLSSDVIRQDSLPPGPEGRYTEAGKMATYQELLARARLALDAGQCVIADATWAGTAVRELASAVALAGRSRLVAIECEAPLDLSAARAQRRLEAGHDRSEAGAVVARQLGAARDPWPEASSIDTSTSAPTSLAAAGALFPGRLRPRVLATRPA
ncbi:aminoglycoside phosphotransferase family enzyme/predicted kinase [Nakamurella sp. UYEF19]|uniref:bifunctional aminoglycoside phosphotransferase/ATP-binding protein n=1 Tax=Nakamurella sp. UYEF19 TaxID=1756392 RepID=UPI00339B996E